MQIRPPTADEIPKVAQLAGQLVRQHHRYDPLRFILVETVEEGYARFFAREIRDTNAVILSAFDGSSEPLGYVYGKLEPRNWNELRDVHGAIHDVYVVESARRRGIAHALVVEALTRLEALGAPRTMLLSAWKNEGAQKLFESLGFRKTMVEMTREAKPSR